MKAIRIISVAAIIFISMTYDITEVHAQKQKIILDCDLGGDIDDAYALALVLSSPEFDVLGIVMDYGRCAPGLLVKYCTSADWKKYRCLSAKRPTIISTASFTGQPALKH
jgi:hypothetical protein